MFKVLSWFLVFTNLSCADKIVKPDNELYQALLYLVDAIEWQIEGWPSTLTFNIKGSFVQRCTDFKMVAMYKNNGSIISEHLKEITDSKTGAPKYCLCLKVKNGKKIKPKT